MQQSYLSVRPPTSLYSLGARPRRPHAAAARQPGAPATATGRTPRAAAEYLQGWAKRCNN
eukprot:4764161-Prymnesium_polylepis.1